MKQEEIGRAAGTVRKRGTVFGIQILRGVAAFIVVIHHAMLSLYGETGPGSRFVQGAVGVDIFFVISGFVIYLTGRKLAWYDFLARRIVRIVPLYWFFITLKLVFMMVAGAGLARATLDGQHVLASYLFIPAYRDVGDPRPLIAAAWTLNYEMFFYAVCALVLAFLPPARMVAGVVAGILIAILAGVLIWTLPMAQDPPAPLYLLHPLCMEFLAGMMLALWWDRGLSLPLPVAVGLIVVGTAWIAIGHEPRMFAFNRPLLWGVPSVMVVAGVLALEGKVAFSGWKPLQVLGDASYALYLSHTAVLPIFAMILLKLGLGGGLGLVILIAACVVAGLFSHWFIEKPMLIGASRLFRLPVKSPAPNSA